MLTFHVSRSRIAEEVQKCRDCGGWEDTPDHVLQEHALWTLAVDYALMHGQTIPSSRDVGVVLHLDGATISICSSRYNLIEA